jgi:acyl-CoA thioesterase FadM
MASISRQHSFILGGVFGFGLTLLCSQFIPDFHYFMKMAYINLTTESLNREEKTNMGFDDSKSPYNSTIFPSDIDRNLHVNNARFVRELCFARRRYFKRLGFWPILEMHRSNMFIVAQSIRYRREMKVWNRFSIVTKVLAISDVDSCFYLESRFVSHADGFVDAVHVCKYKIITGKKESARLSPSKLIKEAGLSPECIPNSPENVEFILHWECANKASSRELLAAARNRV